MESVNNVLFDYKKSGSRYKTGIEDYPEQAVGINFRFHFLNNYYMRKPGTSPPEIHAVIKHGVTDQLKVYVDGNIGPNRTDDTLNPWLSVYVEKGPNILQAPDSIRAQMSDLPLFSSPVPVTMQTAEEAYASVIQSSGCNLWRDSVDTRILSDVINREFNDYLHSQEEVGGWPVLKSTSAPLDTDRDGMPDWWEDDQGLNKNNPEDRNFIPHPDGYTNLENYLNGNHLISGMGKVLQPESYDFDFRNFPNPFNADTQVLYHIPNKTSVLISLYNLTGQHLMDLVNQVQQAGSHQVALSGSHLASGTYIIKMTTKDQSISRKISILK
jgi:hypothetical protein